ncbi:MAG: hypothetical protein AB7I13_00365 [Vicinamibacterales bacterium]
MSVRPQDLVFFAGGECLARHGVLVRRTSIGEDVPETFSRSSVASYISKGGLLRTAAAGIPRVSYLDLDGSRQWVTPALRLENGSTNRMLRSREYDNAAWTKTRVTVTANATAGPDGVATADKIVEDTSDNTHIVYQAPSGATPTDNVASSFFADVKAAERTWVRVRIDRKDGSIVGAYFNLATGAIGTKTADQAWITPLANGFYRCAVSTDVLSGGSPVVGVVQIASGDSGGGGGYAGDGSSGIYLADAQFEVDAKFPSSLIPTAGSVVSRANDDFSYTFPHFVQPFTVFVDAIVNVRGVAGTGTNYGFFTIGDPTATTEWALGRVDGVTGKVASQHGTASSLHTTALLASPVVTFGSRVKSRHVFRADGTNIVGASINGAAEAVSAASSPARLLTTFTEKVIRVGNGTNQRGYLDLLALKVALGEYTLEEMVGA